MPRARSVPSYGLHRPTGQARVRINGKDHYLGPHGSEESRQRYEQIVRKLITDRARDEMKARVQAASDLTVNELAARYLRFARTYYVKRGRPTPEYSNVCRALAPVQKQHGFELVTAFGPLKLKAIRDQWVDAGLVRPQVNARVGRVRRMFAWAVEEELVPADVLHALKAIRGLRMGRCEAKEGRKVEPVEDDRVNAVCPHVSPQVWAMISLQRLTGMRPSEVCAMRGVDISTAGEVWSYQPSEHKGEHHGRVRVVYLGPRAQAILKPWLRTQLEEFLFQPREAEADRAARMRAARKTPVQPSQRDRRKKNPRRIRGTHYTKDTYARAIARACLTAGVAHWSPNQLRHTVATRVRAEIGLEAAQVVLGHSRADVTQIYAERNAELAREAMARLG